MTHTSDLVCGHPSVDYSRVSYVWSDKFPTKDVVHGVQAAVVEGGHIRERASGVGPLDSEGLYRVEHSGHRVTWVPDGADVLKKRLLVFAHLERAGHREVGATMARSDRYSMRVHGNTLSHFTLGDYVLVARVSGQGRRHKLRCTWTGPWRVANDEKEHVYAVHRRRTVRGPRGEDEVLRRWSALDNRGAPRGFPTV